MSIIWLDVSTNYLIVVYKLHAKRYAGMAFSGWFFIAESAEITFACFRQYVLSRKLSRSFTLPRLWQKGWSDMKKDLFALKGTICYSKNQKELVFHETLM